MAPLLTVVVINYNYAKYVRECLDSVLSQTYKQIECIFVDDGSTDDSVEIVRSYGDRVRLIGQENKLQAGARNTGIGAASGQWIAFLDSDDVWHPRKLEIQMNTLSLMPAWGFIGAESTTEEVFEPVGPRPAWQEVSVRDILTSTPLSPSNLIVSRRCFDEVGKFDENSLTGGAAEDKEMWLRLASRFRGGRVKAQLCRYRMHEGQAHRRSEAMIGAEMRILEKFFRTNPSYRSYQRAAFAHFHFIAGLSMRDNAGCPGKAAVHLLKSFAFYPFRYHEEAPSWLRLKVFAVTALNLSGLRGRPDAARPVCSGGK